MLEIAGFRIRAVGGRHAVVFAGEPDCANLGYIVDESLYHRGDALHVLEGDPDAACALTGLVAEYR